MKNFHLILIAIFTSFTMYGQGVDCSSAEPFCTGSPVTFPAGVNNGSAQAGPDYGCLLTQPNPAWYYMELGTSGNLDVEMTNSNGEDIDFILWGPFADEVTPCTALLTAGNTEDCSYATSATETANIVGGVAGEVYILMITNFSNNPTDITFSDVGGSATTDCSIVFPPSCGTVDFHAEESASPYNTISPFPSTMDCEDDAIYLVANDSATAGGYITPALHFEFTPANDPNDYVTIYSGGTGTLGSGTAIYTGPLTNATVLTVYGDHLSPSTDYYVEICDETSVDYYVYDGGTGTIYANGTDASGVGCTRFGPYSPAGSATWATDAPAASVGANDAGFMIFDPVVAGPGTYDFTYYWNLAGCNDSITKSITVTNPYSFTSLSYSTVCKAAGGSTNPTLNATAGGTYSSTAGLSINPSTGVVNVAASTAGTYTVTYTVGTLPCGATGTGTIIIRPDVDPSWTSPGTICEAAGSINLNTTITGTSGGTWSGTGVSGNTFNPSGLSGAISVTYSVGTAPCVETSVQNITVNPDVDPSWTSPGTICEAAGSINLNTTITGTSGGTWSGTGVSGNTFNPSGLSGAISVTYSVGTAPCVETSVQNITVTPDVDPSWTSPGTICEAAGSINLNTTITGTSGGTWSGTGVSGNTFNPSGLSGAISVTYSVGTAPCVETSVQNITVNPDVDPSWTSPGTICEAAGSINLNTTITGTSGGTWSGTGVSGNTFNPSGLSGAISVTYSVGTAPCVETSVQNITVNPDVDPSWTSPGTICEAAGSINLNTTITGTSGGTWSGTGVSGNTFNPSGLSGAISVTYSVGTAPCVETSVQNITVNPDVDPSWTSPGTICEAAGSINLNTTITGTSGGTWSGTGVSGNTFNPSGLSGAISVTYSVGTAPCVETSVQNITVNPDVDPSWTSPGTICEAAGSINLNTTITGTSGGTWSGTGVSGNTFNPSGLSGAISVTYSVGTAPCVETSVQNITVTPDVDPSWTNPGPLCEDNGVVDLSTTITGTSGGTWSGTGVSGSNFDPTGLSGSISVTYTVGTVPCVETSVQSITINQEPPAIDQTPSVCEDAGTPGVATGIDLTALDNSVDGGSGSTVTWYTDSGLSSPVGTPSNTTVNNNDVFYALVDNGNCTDTAMITYTVTPTITVNDPLPQLCEDSAGSGSVANVDLTSYNGSVYAGGGTLTWYEDAGFLTPVATPTNVTIVSGSYDTFFVDIVAGNCSNNTSVTFTVNPLPTSNPSNMELCEDAAGSNQATFDLTSLDNTVNGGSGDAVTWFTDAGTSSSIGTPGAYVSGSTTVYALVTNITTFCTDTAAVVLTVNPLPTSNPTSMEMCDEGNNQATFDLTSLDNTVNGGSGDAVTWFTDAGTSSSIGTPGAYVTGSTTVYALVTDGTTNCTDTAAVTLIVNPLPVVANATINMCDEGSAQATFDLTSVDNTVNGGTANVVTWFDDALATSPIGTPGTYVTGNDTVYAIVTDGTTFCMDTTAVYLIVDPLPTAIDQTPQLCEDAGTPGTVAGVDLTLLNGSIDGGAGNTLTWYADAGLTTPVGTPTNTTVNDNDVYYVLVDNGTCVDTAMITYTVTSTISLNDPSPVLCEDTFGSGNVTNIDLTTYNTSVYSGVSPVYTWYQDAGMTIAVGNPTDTTITDGMMLYVDVTDGTCNNNTVVTFTVNGQSVGVVDSTVCNGGSVTVNGTVYSAATTLSGVEIFTSANNCDSTVTVTITELPLITGVLDSTVCNGGSFVFNGTTYDAANPSGIETLMSASGCDSTITVTLTELPFITGVLDSTVCNGGSFVFNGTTYDAGNTSGTEILMSASGCDSTITVTLTELPLITGVLDSTICSGDSFVFNGTTYDAGNTSGTENLMSASGCDSVVATVTVTISPNLSATPDLVDPICLNEESLILTASSTGFGTITWYDTDGVTVIGTGSPFDATSYATSTGVYTFYVNEENGSNCDGTLTQVVAIVGGVTASISATPDNGFVPLDVEFTNGSTTGVGITYAWDFGDGTGDNIFEPSHIYTDINSYLATLTVTDATGCQATATVSIEVIGESTVLIPNVFTPNGDGSNDVFMVSGTNLESVKGEVFNRWGQKMFEWDHVKGYWDGRTLSGGEAPDGTYFYIIKATGIDGKEYFKKGGFSLIR